MKIATFNANGIRSAFKKDWAKFMLELNVDIICVQELKAQAIDLNINLDLDLNAAHLLDGYYFWGQYAQKKGYSGVGIFSKKMPQKIIYGIDSAEFAPFNNEGRYIQACFDTFDVASVYFPSGTSGNERIQAKFAFQEAIYTYLQQQKHKNILVCGDFNIAHQQIDLKNWKSNLKKSGFLPEERAFFSQLLQNGYHDVFRELYPNLNAYTWWSQRSGAYDKDVGWRIDYHIASQSMAKHVSDIIIYKQPKFSDHAIVVADIDKNVII